MPPYARGHGGPFLLSPPKEAQKRSQGEDRDSETGIRGVKMYRTLEGGGTRPESCPCKAWTFDPQMRSFYRNSIEKGQISGPPKNQNFHPPLLIFGDLTPHYPGLQIDDSCK